MEGFRLALPFALAVACSSGSTARQGGGPPASTLDGGYDGGPLSAHVMGRATYYAADGSGNCSFDPSPNDLDVAAMDAPQWNGSAPCGECVFVQGPSGSVTVRIVDQCPGCETGHLDLSQQAFAQIADVALGNVPITWWVVPCNVTSPIAYRYKEGSSQYWTAIQVRNIRLPVTQLEWLDHGAWSNIPRADYNYFIVASGVGTTGPIQVRTTAIDGEQLVDMLPSVQPALVVSGAAQF